MRLRLIFFLALIFLLTAGNASAQKNKYVGYKHKGVVYGATLPNGAKDLGGGLLSNENYGVSRFSVGKKQMLWLQKILARDRDGVPFWQVKDVLIFDKPKKNEEFLLSYSSTCTQNGRENFDLVVRAEFLPQTKKYKVLEAWRANARRERFEPLPIKGIRCEYIEP
jgi:hypothetical protein